MSAMVLPFMPRKSCTIPDALPGPIVRIAPSEYSLSDPESLKVLYGHGTSFTKVSHAKAADV